MHIWNSYLMSQQGELTREQRKELAAKAFEVVAGYDLAIHEYFNPGKPLGVSKNHKASALRRESTSAGLFRRRLGNYFQAAERKRNFL